MDWKIMQERPPAYWPLGPAIEANIEAFSYAMRPAIGVDCGGSAIVMQKRHQYFCLPADGLRNAEKAIFERQLSEPDFMAGIRRKFEALAPKFLDYCEGLWENSLPGMSNEELAAVFAEWKTEYLRGYVYSEPPAFTLKDALSSHLEAELARLLPGKARAEVGRVFSLLVATPEKPFTTREEEDMLRILLLAQAGNDVSGELARHARAFGWIPFDYGNEVWTVEHFRRQLQDLRSQRFDAQKRLDAINDYYGRLGERQAQVSAAVGLDEALAGQFSALRDCSFLIDSKKEVYTKANLLFYEVWREAARRAGISMSHFRFVSTDEAVAFLSTGKKIERDRLEKRALHCAYACVGDAPSLEEGSHADEFFDKIGLSGKSAQEHTEVKGSCGCAGTAIGRARIILQAKDVGRLKKGEVLVTMMTTPDFVVGMKKAAAIVTNEGGITCHAAIVARELGIPCVVGTGNATKAFHDGDLLEVKASHGTVKKVQAK